VTAITLNLLAEEQLAEQQRARDPFKVAIAIGVSLVTLVVAGGGVMSVLALQKRGEVAALQSRLEDVASPELGEQEAELAALKKSADQIVTVNQKRYLYAAQLALLKDLIPENVQLTEMEFSVAVQTIQIEQPAKSESAVKRPPLLKVVQRLTLRLDGRAVSARPELDVDVLLRTLREHEVLSADIEQIQLRSIARAATGPEANSANLPAAFFVIECQFKEHQ